MKRHLIKVIYIVLLLYPFQAVAWHGLYLGAGLGCFIANHQATHLYSQYDVSQDQWQHKGFINQTQRQQYSQEVFGGYGQVFKHIYLGGELFGRYHHYAGQYLDLFELHPEANATTNPAYSFGSDFSLKSQHTLGGILRAGYLISPNALLYALFGLEATRFRLSFLTDIHGPVFIPEDNLNPVHDTFIQWKAAWISGVGLETTVWSHLLFRTQFVYANYAKFNSQQYQVASNVNSSFQLKDIDISEYIFTVGLVYQLEAMRRISARAQDLDGFYAGIGLISSHSKDRYTFNSTTGSQMDPVAHDLFHAYKGPAGGSQFGSSIFGGYGQMFGPIYGGVEFLYRKVKHHHRGVQWFAYDVSDSTVTLKPGSECYIADLKTDHSFGLVGRVGYLINHKTVVYGVAGYERTKFNMTTYWYEDFYNHAYLHLSQWDHAKTGFISGLGIETALRYRLFLRGQYTYTSYPAIKPAQYMSPQNGDTFPGSLSYQYNMYNSTISLGLVYYL